MNTIITSLVFLTILISALFALNFLLSPSRPDAEKVSAYECGFTTTVSTGKVGREAASQTRSPFNIRFYLVGVLFLLLDLEVALLFPVIVSLGLEGVHLYGFVVAMLFLGLLTVGFVYEFGKGALHISEQRASLNRSAQIL
jgi:NADH:ubiquinone oxidoreductase subunit 3 (subunit A)